MNYRKKMPAAIFKLNFTNNRLSEISQKLLGIQSPNFRFVDDCGIFSKNCG